jgi:DNA-binding NarL/FixJ family response regulator
MTHSGAFLVDTVCNLWGTVVLEPDQLARFAVQALLAQAGMRIDHSGGDCEEALDACRQAGTGLLLTEISLPGTSFARFARRALEERPNLRIVVLTGEEDGTLLREAVTAGACAILSKYADPGGIAGRVSSCRRGGLTLDEVTMPLVVSDLPHPENPPALTVREREILSLLSCGLTMHMAARRLGLAESTVKTHAAKASARLGASNAREAVRLARRFGVI